MAKYEVAGFDIQVKDNGNGVNNIYLTINTSKKKLSYRIWKDERYPDLLTIGKYLEDGLKLAKSTSAKIEVSDYRERLYVFFKLPEQDQHQFSAEKLDQ
ncbi:hypothetical protein J8L73_18445 [Pseudoalteromonas sp. MMG006]|uniref:hypothetical protein n=1 Tax=Pseudoalteromonas sp. MMG006 TaxID=2822683 RepID=UPI001B35DAAC|nr:hypothetical protein [Pseudoalteromonas sp. MMG006]MBQ4801075.1 hypothetical protein [Pseudoalteromonas sp. MMG006]